MGKRRSSLAGTFLLAAILTPPLSRSAVVLGAPRLTQANGFSAGSGVGVINRGPSLSGGSRMEPLAPSHAALPKIFADIAVNPEAQSVAEQFLEQFAAARADVNLEQAAGARFFDGQLAALRDNTAVSVPGASLSSLTFNILTKSRGSRAKGTSAPMPALQGPDDPKDIWTKLARAVNEAKRRDAAIRKLVPPMVVFGFLPVFLPFPELLMVWFFDIFAGLAVAVAYQSVKKRRAQELVWSILSVLSPTELGEVKRKLAFREMTDFLFDVYGPLQIIAARVQGYEAGDLTTKAESVAKRRKDIAELQRFESDLVAGNNGEWSLSSAAYHIRSLSAETLRLYEDYTTKDCTLGVLDRRKQLAQLARLKDLLDAVAPKTS
jgi:hypothetical protein